MSRSTRSAIFMSAFGLLIATAGCERDDGAGYCDDSGCFGCSDKGRQNCWPLPHETCEKTVDCNGNQVCTSVGCSTTCAADADCRNGEYCTAQSYCAPKGVPTTPVDKVDPTPHAPSCGIPTSQCAANAD